MNKILVWKDELGHELVYGALVAFPDLEKAKACIEAQGYTITMPFLKTFVGGGKSQKGIERYEQVRKQLAPQLEGSLASDLLDNARLATEVERVAIERTGQLLREGRISDPSRVARDLSQLRTQAIDKRLALQGRPSQIVENRNVDELVRALEGMGVAEQVSIESTAVEDEDRIDG